MGLARRRGCNTCSGTCSTSIRRRRCPCTPPRFTNRWWALLFWVRKNLRFRGQVFLVFTFAYGALRFLLEMIRDDTERGEFGPHIPEHVMIAGGLLAFAAAYAVFMAPSVGDPIMRKITQAVAFVPPVVAFLLLKPPSFGEETLVQLSTSQWVALVTAIPAAVTYGIFFKAAQAHPDSAMAVNLEEFYKLHPEALPAAVDERESEGEDAKPGPSPPAGESCSPGPSGRPWPGGSGNTGSAGS